MFTKKMLTATVLAVCLMASPALANGHNGGHGGRGGGHGGYNDGYRHHGGGNNWQVPAIIGGTILGLGVTSMILANRDEPQTNYYVVPQPQYVPAPSYYVAPSCRSFTQTTYTPEGYTYYVTNEMCMGPDGLWRIVR